jgi:MSHA pilin protein MshB
MRSKNKYSGRERRRYEFFIVAVVIGLITLVAIDRYLELGRETRRIGFELLAHHFATAVAGVRVQWLLNKTHAGNRGETNSQVELDGFRFYMNEGGWPAQVAHDEEKKDSQDNGQKNEQQEVQLTAAGCLKLWQALLQNSPQASVEGMQARGSQRYHIRLLEEGVCRYERVFKGVNNIYFDYASSNGQVTINGPAHTQGTEK